MLECFTLARSGHCWTLVSVNSRVGVVGRPPAVEHSVSYLRFSRVRALPRPDSSTRFDSSDRNASSAGVCLAIRRVVSYGGWFLLVSSIAAAYQAQSCMRLLEVEIEEDAISMIEVGLCVD